MAEPRILYCVGATKAGTSWLYRALHDHPGCALKSVKELHYWDTFEADVRDRQLAAFERRIEQYAAQKAEAAAGDRGWQVANMDRRLHDLRGLIDVVGGDRADDAAYADWIGHGTDRRLAADMTPNYALLDHATLTRMVARTPGALWVYLIRDPLARLWSHIRMQAQRQRQPHETHADKANNILWRILNKGHETHVSDRGDYAGTVARLRAAVPADRLRVEFCERLFTAPGWAAMCAFLGIDATDADGGDLAHEGPKAAMRSDLRPQTLQFLRNQYEWAAREMGDLPDAWQANMKSLA